MLVSDRYGRFKMDAPKVWNGDRPDETTDRGWCLPRQGEMLDGKTMVDLGGYSVRFRLRDDSKTSTSEHRGDPPAPTPSSPTIITTSEATKTVSPAHSATLSTAGSTPTPSVPETAPTTTIDMTTSVVVPSGAPASPVALQEPRSNSADILARSVQAAVYLSIPTEVIAPAPTCDSPSCRCPFHQIVPNDFLGLCSIQNAIRKPLLSS
jgi:hypothetical protein